MPSYDATRLQPPAPVARVTLRNRESGRMQADVLMLLDSGADATLLPQSVVDDLGVEPEPNRGYELVGFDGTPSLSQVVHLDLLFLGRTFRGRFLLIDQEWGIMGRNITNSLRLVFDGPSLSWDEATQK